ncbi:MAG: hypothetical protein CEN90_126 [Parcubacteria group bacterium Licking1014_17]|nr:MAG: hypothetical protein CEN90_126 [Parcubacteria group bacterium Licking1014_17]
METTESGKSKVGEWLNNYKSDILLALSIILVVFISYHIGKIAAYQEQQKKIVVTKTGDAAVAQKQALPSASSKPRSENSQVIASKKSESKLYHFPWCSGYGRILPANKIVFETEAAAIAAGYTLAGNCTR